MTANLMLHSYTSHVNSTTAADT